MQKKNVKKGGSANQWEILRHVQAELSSRPDAWSKQVLSLPRFVIRVPVAAYRQTLESEGLSKGPGDTYHGDLPKPFGIALGNAIVALTIAQDCPGEVQVQRRQWWDTRGLIRLRGELLRVLSSARDGKATSKADVEGLSLAFRALGYNALDDANESLSLMGYTNDQLKLVIGIVTKVRAYLRPEVAAVLRPGRKTIHPALNFIVLLQLDQWEQLLSRLYRICSAAQARGLRRTRSTNRGAILAETKQSIQDWKGAAMHRLSADAFYQRRILHLESSTVMTLEALSKYPDRPLGFPNTKRHENRFVDAELNFWSRNLPITKKWSAATLRGKLRDFRRSAGGPQQMTLVSDATP